ncbi:hypothetical protein Pla111_12010 [Botrimarina hoheduenensis]|uniref:Uncharacterized protein n=1 Tax=Botrimarina hoheduenensis TaxID=2528000 RepID=A0A5C5W9P7_9BACT|nr:hypothetical protein Pla111_12010 [Botrimarina hoheduenensis]
MPLDSSSQASLAESYVLIVSADGTCVLHPRVPEYVGQKPWEWCTSEDSEACREAFVQACMFRKESQFITHMRYDGRIFKPSTITCVLVNSNVWRPISTTTVGPELSIPKPENSPVAVICRLAPLGNVALPLA